VTEYANADTVYIGFDCELAFDSELAATEVVVKLT